METLSVSKFKAICLSIIERIHRTGQGVLLTKKGKPVAQVLPPPPPEPARESRYGSMAGTLREKGDIVAPVATEDWEALR